MKEELFRGVIKKKKRRLDQEKQNLRERSAKGKELPDNIFCLVRELCHKGNSEGHID